jgi:hypothetical protein
LVSDETDARVCRLVSRIGGHVVTTNGRTWHVLDGLSEVAVRHSLAAAEVHAHRLEVEARIISKRKNQDAS